MYGFRGGGHIFEHRAANGTTYAKHALHSFIPSPNHRRASRQGLGPHWGRHRSRVRHKCTNSCVHVARWAKVGQNGLKMGPIHTFEHPKWPKIIFGKTHFLTRFSHIFGPPMAHFQSFFWTLEGPKRLKMGSKWAHFTCLCTPSAPGSFLEGTFLTHFCPKTAHVKGILAFLEGQIGPPWAHPTWSRIIFETSHFFAPSGPR